MTPTWPKTSQRQLWLLLESFLRSESHTVASALATLGIYALSQRCGQLTRMGWPVYSVWEPHDGGQHLRYCLPAEFLRKQREAA